MPRTEDAFAVARTLDGDSDAFTALVERYRQAVYAIAYHYLSNDEEARDAAQEAFVLAYARLSKLRDPGGFGPWLKVITTNVCRMWKRSQRSTLPLEERRMSPAETDRWATRLTVRKAMECLSEEARVTVSLYYAGSYSLEEIGAFLGDPVTTIKSRLRNARARLRKELEQVVEEALQPEPLPADFSTRVLAIIRAARSGDLQAVQGLAESDKRLLAARDSLGNSPLVEALNAGHTEVAEELVERGAEMDVWAAASAGDVERLGSLIGEEPALVHTFSLQGFTPLHLAAHFGHCAAVQLLLDRGAEPNVVSRHPLKVMALHAALFGRRSEVALMLLAHGADPCAAKSSMDHERDGWTPLHYAVAYGMGEVLRVLIERGADPDQPDARGMTPAELARASGNETVFRKGER